jgi:hypothetical protein
MGDGRKILGVLAAFFSALAVMTAGCGEPVYSTGGGEGGTTPSPNLLDDFEGEIGRNYFGGGWFFYDDSHEVSNDPSHQGVRGTSQILSGVRVDNYWYFGENSVTAVNGYSGTISGKLEFALGSGIPMVGYVLNPFVAIATELAPSGIPIGAKFNSAESVTFWARSSSNMNVIFKVSTMETDNSHAHYQTLISVTNQWRKFEIGLNTVDLSQPDWTSEDAVVPFIKASARNFEWEIRGDDNPALTSGTLLIDEVVVNGYNHY